MILEDAEDQSTDRWSITNAYSGSAISNVVDAEQGRVINFYGDGSVGQGYQFLGDGSTGLGADNHRYLQWDMKASATGYIWYVSVNTTDGEGATLRYKGIMPYTADQAAEIIHLGSQATDGTWHTFKLDLVDDLAYLYPDKTYTGFNGIALLGGVSIDNIVLKMNEEISYVKGTIQDGGGSPLNEAVINLVSVDDRSKYYTDYSNEDGNYRFKNVEPGDYMLKVSLAGYAFEDVAINVSAENLAVTVDVMANSD